MYKQIIIARKDLNMSPGKLAAQVSHASMAFLVNAVKNSATPVWKYDRLRCSKVNKQTGKREPVLYKRGDLCSLSITAFNNGESTFSVKHTDENDVWSPFVVCENEIDVYRSVIDLDRDIYEQWINGSLTKVVLGAKNKTSLLKAKEIAERLGMKENVDFFLIYDNCNTELEPEEIWEDGVGRTLTCIGFKPADECIIDSIGKKYHLYT